jgi:hypothetical protein
VFVDIIERMFPKVIAVVAGLLLTLSLTARTSSGSGREQAYVVRPTDTLWSIAASHYPGDPRAAVWKLEQRNGLHGTLLRPGERLVLPP